MSAELRLAYVRCSARRNDSPLDRLSACAAAAKASAILHELCENPNAASKDSYLKFTSGALNQDESEILVSESLDYIASALESSSLILVMAVEKVVKQYLELLASNTLKNIPQDTQSETETNSPLPHVAALNFARRSMEVLRAFASRYDGESSLRFLFTNDAQLGPSYNLARGRALQILQLVRHCLTVIASATLRQICFALPDALEISTTLTSINMQNVSANIAQEKLVETLEYSFSYLLQETVCGTTLGLQAQSFVEALQPLIIPLTTLIEDYRVFGTAPLSKLLGVVTSTTAKTTVTNTKPYTKLNLVSEVLPRLIEVSNVALASVPTPESLSATPHLIMIAALGSLLQASTAIQAVPSLVPLKTMCSLNKTSEPTKFAEELLQLALSLSKLPSKKRDRIEFESAIARACLSIKECVRLARDSCIVFAASSTINPSRIIQTSTENSSASSHPSLIAIYFCYTFAIIPHIAYLMKILTPILDIAQDEIRAGGEKKGIVIGSARAVQSILRNLTLEVSNIEQELGIDAARICPAWKAYSSRIQNSSSPVWSLPILAEFVVLVGSSLENVMRVEDTSKTTTTQDTEKIDTN
jgi:hypothetical protein